MTSSEKNSPLLSIVIPTRNRQKYAISAITSILNNITALDLELVVHDNSDSRDLEEYIRSNINDSRLRYKHLSTPRSMIDNWDAAVRLASGKYLCLIGDDDGVNPEIIEATRWADMNDVDALKPTVRAAYLWPNSGVSSVSSGVFTLNPFSGKVIRPDPEVEIRKIVRSGGWRYLETEIPRLYHGIVKRKYLDKAREKTGASFGGVSPDIYAAVAIANFTKNVVSIDYPLTIAGVSKSSGSALSARDEEVGSLEDGHHSRYTCAYKSTDIKWAEIIPRFHNVQTCWANAAVAALKVMGRDDLLRDFNLPLLAAHCVAAHPKYTRIILRDMYKSFRVMNKNQLAGTFQFCYSFLLVIPRKELLIKYIPQRIKGILRVLLGMRSINDVKDIVEATDILTDYLRKSKKCFLDCVS
jgi:glycosyltransferase involved in cell wall biosynthesis